MGDHRGFSINEWRTLQFAPFWMFSAVVGTYRYFDEADRAAFLRTLQSPAAGQCQLVRDVFDSVVADFDSLTDEYGADARPILSGLCEVARIVEKAPRAEAEEFLNTLLSGVGAGVARARGRYGRVIDEDDEKMLALIAGALAA
jgi:hypothetical protein